MAIQSPIHGLEPERDLVFVRDLITGCTRYQAVVEFAGQSSYTAYIGSLFAEAAKKTLRDATVEAAAELDFTVDHTDELVTTATCLMPEEVCWVGMRQFMFGRIAEGLIEAGQIDRANNIFDELIVLRAEKDIVSAALFGGLEALYQQNTTT